MLNWPFTAGATLVVQGVEFWIAFIGFPLTIGGLVLALRQISQITAITKAVAGELSRVKASLHIYDANHELAKASQALQSAKKHLQKREWGEIAQDYSEFISSMHIVTSLNVDGLSVFDPKITDALQYANKFCERVEGNEEAHAKIDIAKTGSALREQEQLISSLNIVLQGRALK